MSNIIWVHEDALSDNHPVFNAAGYEARAVFVWDEGYLRAQGYSVKRLTFLLECLGNMNVEFYKGDTKTVLRELSDAAQIYTAATPNPAFNEIINALDITAVEDVPLARIDAPADLGRFFRYWKKAGKSVMGHNGFPGGQEDMFS
jgi:hypothetical protein